MRLAYWVILFLFGLIGSNFISDFKTVDCHASSYLYPTIIWMSFSCILFYFKWKNTYLISTLLVLFLAGFFFATIFQNSVLTYTARTGKPHLSKIFILLGASPDKATEEPVGKHSDYLSPPAAHAATCGNTRTMQVLMEDLHSSENIMVAIVHAFHFKTSEKQKNIALDYARNLPDKKRLEACKILEKYEKPFFRFYLLKDADLERIASTLCNND